MDISSECDVESVRGRSEQGRCHLIHGETGNFEPYTEGPFVYAEGPAPYAEGLKAPE